MIQNNQPPDVLNLNAFAAYAKDGLLYPAADVLSPQTAADFLEPFARGGQYGGALYGFPILSSARAFFYNTELFGRAGIAAPPRTWDEFLRDAQAISRLGGGTIGYALPLGPEEAQAEWSIWMWNNGGDWKAAERWTINSERNVQTLSFLAALANTHRVTQVNPGKTNRTDGAFQLFKDGKVAVVTGAGSGIGQEAARAFAARYARKFYPWYLDHLGVRGPEADAFRRLHVRLHEAMQAVIEASDVPVVRWSRFTGATGPDAFPNETMRPRGARHSRKNSPWPRCTPAAAR